MSARILIVDDEPHIRTVMRLALESTGYEVGEAASGEDALAKITEGSGGDGGGGWNLILLDERMPGIDGLETLRRLRQRDAAINVIMVTAFASIELAVDAMKLGAMDFLRKPTTPDVLRAAVEGALAKRSGASSAAPVTVRTAADATGGDAAAAAAPPIERPYEIGMFNGYRLRHVAPGDHPSEQRFDVIRRDTGVPRRVLVRFSPESIAAATHTAGHSLDDASQFWIQQAGFALTHYVWNHAAPPEDGLLLVVRPTADLLEAAMLLCSKRPETTFKG